MDVAAWLRDLGLGHYAQTFADHHVDGEVLARLTSDDLIALGVTSVGHRRTLISAIAALAASPAAAGGPDGEERSKVAIAHAAREGERRQLTVLFVDLVGSTRLAAELDPEDMREILRGYRMICTEVVPAHEGSVARYIGDGVLAYFGYPIAHEDAAVRAVRAGLDITSRLRGWRPPVPLPEHLTLHARVGIHTGLVVTGAADDRTVDAMDVIGETPNIASRLQDLAAPDSVVVSGATLRLVRGLFLVDELGSQQLKGIERPLPVFAIRGPSAAVVRFEAAFASGLTPLVDRAEEVALLIDRWRQSCEGRGQVIQISGEAGLGKSRIVQVLEERAAAAQHPRIRLQCSPYHANSALYPIVRHLEQAAAIERDDEPELRLHKLEQTIAEGAPGFDGDLPVLADLLSIPTVAPSPLHNLHPEQQKERILGTLTRYLERTAERLPTLLIVEDAHWIDPTSLELIEHLVERIAGRPMLLAVTFRPEFLPPWAIRPHITAFALGRLPSTDGSTLIEQLTQGKPLPAEVQDQILGKTDGVPLFLEELTKTVLESGLLLDQGDRFVLAAPLPQIDIPATLQDSLIARLDRLAEVKDVAQTAAVIGREFSYELLAAVAPVSVAALDRALERLEASGLVSSRRSGRELLYSFKHALVRDAAYSSLLRSRRQQVHARIAQVLVDRFPQVARTEPELIAHHFTEARLALQASRYWLAAGRRASERSASSEAVSHLRRGLDLMRALPPARAHLELTLEILITLGPALIMTRGPGTREVEDVYAQALEVCAELPPSPAHLTASWGWWRVSKDFRSMAERADRLLALAEQLEDPAMLLQAHHCQWATHFNLGDPEGCCRHIEIGLDLYTRGDYRTHASLYGGHDARACGLGELALARWLLGCPDEGRHHVAQSLAWARELEHAGSLIHAMDIALMYRLYRRDVAAVLAQARELIAFTGERGFNDHLAKGNLFLGWARAQQGEVSAGLELIRSALDQQRVIATREDFPIYSDMMAETYALAGEIESGLTEVRQAIEEADQVSLCIWVAELHRRRGDLLRQAGGDLAEVAGCFDKARRVAQSQKARSLELRAATSLASLWMEHGEAERGRALLAPLYAWFREGFETEDLRRAKAVLDRLA